MHKREQAYNYIRGRILDATLPGGSRTSEREIEALAERDKISMSRTPIREALAVLAASGLIEQIPQIGARVRRIDAAEALRTLRLRSGMEGVIVDELATHEHPDLQQAKAALKRMRRAGSEDPSTFQLADTEFHVALALAAGFFSARTSLEGLRDRIHLFGLGTGLEQRATRAVLAEHRVLLARIADHDRDGAVEALNAHLAASS